MEQLVLHLIGDYLLQSDWMATNKTTKFIPAFTHAVIYASLFLLVSHWRAVLIIFITHFVIDRFRLVQYILRIKEIRWIYLWKKAERTVKYDKLKSYLRNLSVFWNLPTRKFGYNTVDKPEYMWVWLLIIGDNTLHLIINYFSIKYLG